MAPKRKKRSKAAVALGRLRWRGVAKAKRIEHAKMMRAKQLEDQEKKLASG